MPQKGVIIHVIDTVKYIYTDYGKNANLLETIPNYFEVVAEHNYNGEFVLSGNSKNLRIKVRKNRFSIENSLCKWYLGENINTLSQAQVRLANEKLSDTFHVNINEANVTRLDLAKTFQMQYPVECYLSTLGQLNRYKRLEQPNGVIYRTNSKELIFYDKIKELKHNKGENIPHGQNLLRYELRFKNSLKKHFNQSVITPKTLSDDNFFRNAEKKYIAAYAQIQMNKIFNFSIGNAKGIKGLSNLGIAHLLKDIPAHIIIEQIKQLHKAGQISEKEKRGMTNKLKQLESNSDNFFDNKYVNEFNLKILSHFPNFFLRIDYNS